MTIDEQVREAGTSLSHIPRDIPPNLWDVQVRDAVELCNFRFKHNWSGEMVDEITRIIILNQKDLSAHRYKQYVKTGGAHVITKEGEQISQGSAQGSSFVTGGRLTGDQIFLHTEYGDVNTTTERILSFKLFQQDVLRSTGQLYKSIFRKTHELNLEQWLHVIVKIDKAEDDDTLPQNIFKAYLEEFLAEAETEEIRFEGVIKHKHRAFYKQGREYIFSPDALMDYLKNVDKERKWKKSEVKIHLQVIYGHLFSSDKRAFYNRVFTILTPHTHDRAQILNDGGSGENDTATQGCAADSLNGSNTAGDSDPILLKDDSGGSKDTPAQADDAPF